MAIVANFDMLTKRRRYSRSSCYSEKKKNVQGCVSQNPDPTTSILRKVEELRLNASTGHTMKYSGCTWHKIEYGKEKDNLEALSKKMNLMREILVRPVLRKTTRGNLTTSRLYQQSSVELGEKISKLKLKTTTFNSPEKASETQQIECLLCIREHQCTMLSKVNCAQIQWIL